MKIAIAGVLSKPIRKDIPGGTEVFTYLLVKGLVELGHEVTLYCAKGSKTAAQHQIEICDSREAIRTESNVELIYPYTLLQIRQILEDMKKQHFDIFHINCLKTFMFSYFADQIPIPIVHTIHRDFMSNKQLFTVYDRIGFHTNEYFVFVSENACRQSILQKNTHVIHNGIDVNDYPFLSAKNQSFFLWISRIDPLKGPKEAILSAKKTGERLILTGSRDKQKYEDYFKMEIQPLLDEKITYEEPSTFQRKIELFQKAKAFVFPIQWEEPFGLVVTESLSCGTPVITFDRGAMSEIVTNNVTGYIVPPKEGIDGIARAIKKMNTLSEEEYKEMRKNCRASIEKRFSYTFTAQSYEHLYRNILHTAH